MSVSWAALWLEKARLATAGRSTLEPAGPAEEVWGGERDEQPERYLQSLGADVRPRAAWAATLATWPQLHEDGEVVPGSCRPPSQPLSSGNYLRRKSHCYGEASWLVWLSLASTFTALIPEWVPLVTQSLPGGLQKPT